MNTNDLHRRYPMFEVNGRVGYYNDDHIFVDCGPMTDDIRAAMYSKPIANSIGAERIEDEPLPPSNSGDE